MSTSAHATDTQNFRYRAASRDGAVAEGVIVATSRARAIEALRAREQWPIEIEAIQSRSSQSIRVSVADLGAGFRVLATILDAHVPVGRIVSVAAPSLPASWQSALPRVAATLESGEPLSASLSRAGLRMPPSILGLLGAGEAAGDLSGALRRSAELAETAAQTRSAILSALAYPVLLLAASGGVVGLLVTVVIPRFAEVLTNLGQELPPSTILVLSVASFLRAAVVPVGVLTAVGVALVFATLRTADGRARLHELLLSIPVLGALRHGIATARFTAALAALLDSGMTVARAIPFAAAASGDAAVERRLISARRKVVEGETIARALAQTRALTDSATRLIGAGEAGGALAALLRHASTLESEGATAKTKRIMRVLEPALILLLGGVVSSVAVALLQAVYSVRADRL